MKNQTSIDFTELPKVTKLYQDYIGDFDRLKHFYQTDYRNLECDEKSAAAIDIGCPHRNILSEVLLEQNQYPGVTEETLDNIRALGSPGTMAIVTGQQVGLLTGPIYTIYKAITAVKLADELNLRYPEHKFVPVFWLEGEDHDFEEVSKIGLINPDQNFSAVEYTPGKKSSTGNFGPVGEMIIDDDISLFFDSVYKNLHQSEFRAPMLELVKEFYRPGATFNQSFMRMMNHLFKGNGLVFISSNNRQLKKLLSPIFQKEISGFPKVSRLIIERSAELEEQYHAQIKTKALNLFYFHKHGRYFIEPRETDFSLRGTRHFISKEELDSTASESPELLSPNVALRPICQDFLLPTFAYVAGPSEIAYFAQLKKVYQYFGMTMPVIYPRASATVIEGKYEKIMEKYQLGLLELFGDRQKINTRVIDFVSEVRIDDMFTEANEKVKNLTGEMRFGLNFIDSTLSGALETATEKINQQLDILKNKVTEAQSRKHDTALRQVNKVANNIYPNQNFQERELNIIHFINKYGPGFVDSLKNEISIMDFKHQILIVE